MSLAQALLAEFEQDSPATRRVLERIPTDRLDYKPHEKSMSIGNLAMHLAHMPDWGATTLETEILELNDSPMPPTPKSTEEILSHFDANKARYAEVLGKTSDEEMMAVWSMTMNGDEIMKMPRLHVLRAMIMNHSYHHRGQLSVYLRLLDVPVPAVFGPTADEPSGM